MKRKLMGAMLMVGFPLLGIAFGGAPAMAQCYTCDLDTDLCAKQADGKFGFSECWVGEGPVSGQGICLPDEGSELCGGFALSPVEEEAATQEVLALVAGGGMLPADTPYFVATQGDRLLVRKKCGGSLVGFVVAQGSDGVLPGLKLG
ncbi:MAG: hypothetical protein F4Z31_05410 [Gemmatimonadetes bacterium]|nr:hypothetical protein [Gemmatimonadota bacterium]MYA41171.1 hypothetical protein [Gemmatimonadota bacterium]MYE94717.1 hypothetical protein [Gemmatimonadota bacterium]MYJ09016.1 hypothetical protein [Gemmatimonadota bacterium]